jgi:hypothetical protein
MTDRDELADLIVGVDGDPYAVADAVLAKYKVEKRPEPRHWPGVNNMLCGLCGGHWPCDTYLVENARPCSRCPHRIATHWVGGCDHDGCSCTLEFGGYR